MSCCLAKLSTPTICSSRESGTGARAGGYVPRPRPGHQRPSSQMGEAGDCIMVDQHVSDSQLKADRFPLPRNMRAVQVGAFGGIEQLHLSSISVPTPRKGEVLVRVGAAGVGPWDALIREGRSGLAVTLPVTLGADVSGVIVEVGDEVE